MTLQPYYRQNGDLELEECPTCGAPKILSQYNWHYDRGVIRNRITKRRMVIMGPQELDPVFSELEAELGETIPQVVVEAQRRFTRTGIYPLAELGEESDFRVLMALRGLGNMKEFNIRRKRMRVRLENVVLPLVIVGLAQGFFEMALGVDSTVEWELSEEGNLEIAVTPR